MFVLGSQNGVLYIGVEGGDGEERARMHSGWQRPHHPHKKYSSLLEQTVSFSFSTYFLAETSFSSAAAFSEIPSHDILKTLPSNRRRGSET